MVKVDGNRVDSPGALVSAAKGRTDDRRRTAGWNAMPATPPAGHRHCAIAAEHSTVITGFPAHCQVR